MSQGQWHRGVICKEDHSGHMYKDGSEWETGQKWGASLFPLIKVALLKNKFSPSGDLFTLWGVRNSFGISSV